MATVNIMYPSGHNFDMEYYLSKHFAIVEKHWKPLGLQAFEVVTLESGQEYQVQAILKWDKLESHAAATKSEGAKAVFEDIRNYTTAKPVVLFGRNTAGKSLL